VYSPSKQSYINHTHSISWVCHPIVGRVFPLRGGSKTVSSIQSRALQAVLHGAREKRALTTRFKNAIFAGIALGAPRIAAHVSVSGMRASMRIR
ncbi:unnamed protein product, partial [Ascophyllum nodosum]